MEKRVFWAIFISLLFIIGYSYLISKFYPPSPQPPASTPPPASSPKVKRENEKIFPQQEEKLPSVKIKNFIITYSAKGGYIKNIQITPYKENLLFQNIGFVPQDRDKTYLVHIEEDRIIFTYDKEIKEFIFKEYLLILKITPAKNIFLFSNSLSSNMLDQRYQEFFYTQDNLIQRKGFKSLQSTELSQVKFAGSRNRYFCATLLKGEYNIHWKKTSQQIGLYLTNPPQEISLYLGPHSRKYLKAYDLEEVIYYGTFHILAVGLIKLLFFFHNLTYNWGIIIILLTIFIYLLLFPFTLKSTRAMRKMQQIQPLLEELKNKYRDNPQKLQREQLELFKKEGINPLGGCLPLLFQFPIFFVLYYHVLSRLVELKGAKFLWIKDLSLPDRAVELPFNIPFLGNYINLLPILMVIVGLLQHKLTSSTSSEQKQMGLFFSIFFGVILYNFPSSLILYWLIQSFLTFLYQLKVARS